MLRLEIVFSMGKGLVHRVSSCVDAFDEPLQDAVPDFFFADLVLDAMFEVRIVVNLDHCDGIASLLDVDAIEAGTDRARRAQRDVDHLGGRVSQREGAKPAFLRAAWP